jgi:hypothetical protein
MRRRDAFIAIRPQSLEAVGVIDSPLARIGKSRVSNVTRFGLKRSLC